MIRRMSLQDAEREAKEKAENEAARKRGEAAANTKAASIVLYNRRYRRSTIITRFTLILKGKG